MPVVQNIPKLPFHIGQGLSIIGWLRRWPSWSSATTQPDRFYR
jgi:hypothetical protein